MMRFELKRACANRLFALALVLACALALAQLLTVVVPLGLGAEWSFWRAGSKGYYPNSLFNSWIGETPYSIWSVLYFFVLPLLVCLPYADSLYTDVKSGFVANVLSRGSTVRYFRAKTLAVFLSGGVVGTLPLIFNLVATALLVPVFQPEPAAGTFFVAPYAMFADLFYSDPWLYTAFFMVLCFVLSGLVACTSLVFSFMVSNRFMALASPFLLCSIAYFALGDHAGYSPVNLLNPAQVYRVEPLFVLIAYAALSAFVALFIVWRCRRFEAR